MDAGALVDSFIIVMCPWFSDKDGCSFSIEFAPLTE
jgi:hypothetical protein